MYGFPEVAASAASRLGRLGTPGSTDRIPSVWTCRVSHTTYAVDLRGCEPRSRTHCVRSPRDWPSKIQNFIKLFKRFWTSVLSSRVAKFPRALMWPGPGVQELLHLRTAGTAKGEGPTGEAELGKAKCSTLAGCDGRAGTKYHPAQD